MSPLKAFIVQEDYENTGGVIFAKHAIVARRLGANEYNDGEFGGMTCRRAPGLDKYAPGPVPWVELFNMGWWIDCHGCGQRIAEDETDDNDDPVEFNITEVGTAVYCTPECRAEKLANDALDEKIGAAAVAQMAERILEAMPGAVITGLAHVYIPQGELPRAPKQVWVDFTFPGQRIGPARFRYDKVGEKPHFTCCRGDHAAFMAWQAEGYPPHMMDAAA